MNETPFIGAGKVMIDDEAVWNQVLCPPGELAGRPALFLDRDGVVVEEVNYLHRVEDTRLAAGARATIGKANRLGLAVILVTNQAGIGRGFYGWAEFAIVQEHILGLLGAAGATVDAVFACPHSPKGVDPFRNPHHPARKPNPGMLLRAETALDIDLASSWIVGDRAADLEAGKRAGTAGGVHVLMGHGGRRGERASALGLADATFQALGAYGLTDAAAAIPHLQETEVRGRQRPP